MNTAVNFNNQPVFKTVEIGHKKASAPFQLKWNLMLSDNSLSFNFTVTNRLPEFYLGPGASISQ